MPWNPVHRFPKLLELVIQKGNNRKLSKYEFENEIIKYFGITGKTTITNYISIMERLRYIEVKGNLIIIKNLNEINNLELD